MKYDICVVSSSRADFGLLLPLLRRLEASDSLALKFLVTGSHLSLKHGYTVDEIEKSGIPIVAKVRTDPEDTSATKLRATFQTQLKPFYRVKSNCPECPGGLG